ncbi:MAG: hypothetical protein KFF77_01620 [Bacteroidetes bacterium]|nr:hypothetical protein [Bacteroidota bacterium]
MIVRTHPSLFVPAVGVLLAAVVFTACVAPTDPDTPRRRIADPAPFFLRTIDLSEYDEGFDVQALEDGGFIIVGRTWMQHTTSKDVLLLRIDADGQTKWMKTFGGVYTDEGYSVNQTTDGGFILTGMTESYTNGNSDVWLIKTDAGGNMQWSKSFGGTGLDSGQDVIECSSGGYLVAGYGQLSFAGRLYAVLIRTDELGSEIWKKTYGLSERDLFTSVIEAEDGGFVVAGSTETGDNGSTVLWLQKVDATGEIGAQGWSQFVDGPNSKSAFQLIRSTSGTFGIIGYTTSPGSENSSLLFLRTDVTGDMMVETQPQQNAIGTGIAATSEGGFIVCGYTDPLGFDGSDIILMKLDADGGLVWKREIGGTRMDRAHSVCAVADGSFVLTGTTQSYGSGDQDLLILKTDANGMFEE